MAKKKTLDPAKVQPVQCFLIYSTTFLKSGWQMGGKTHIWNAKNT
jgi:hypothetical protein